MGNASVHAQAKYLPEHDAFSRFAICLSGGGFRATVFHIGMLKRLNELGLLPLVDTVSAVSGGSITAAVLAMAWKNLEVDEHGVFGNFDELVSDPLERFVQTNFRNKTVVMNYVNPLKWLKLARRDYSVTDLIADGYDQALFRGLTLDRLPTHPNFVFNATDVKTGELWTFTPSGVGEALLGFMPARDFRLATAVAASSAFPIVFPPLLLDFQPERFERGLLSEAADQFRDEIALTDGGVIDNLGLEAVWKDHGTIICSDAGQGFEFKPEYHDWMGSRLYRTFDVVYSRMHEVRKRWLISSFLNKSIKGSYVGLASYHGNYGLPGSVGYPADVVDQIGRIRTDLDRFSAEEIKVLENHGYTLADTAVRKYMADWMLERPSMLTLPFPDLVERSDVLQAIERSGKLRLFAKTKNPPVNLRQVA